MAGRRADRPLERWLVLRRWQRRAAGTVVLLVLGVLAVRGGWRPWAEAERLGRVEGRVVAVAEGLRLTVEDSAGVRHALRLLGLRQPGPWRELSTGWLRGELLDRRVTCTWASARASDGEPTVRAAYVYRADGVFVNQLMLDAGYATSDAAAQHDLAAWFAQLRDWAAGEGRGLWAADGARAVKRATGR